MFLNRTPVKNLFILKNSPMSSRIESRVSEESSGLRWDMGLTLEGAEVLHFLM